MSCSVTLPVEYDRNFSLHFYWVSHGVLLLRSGTTNEHSSRIEILFSDVLWMALPVWLEGVRIERGELSDIPLPLTTMIKEEARFRTVFRVISQGVTHCVLAGQVVQVVEDKLPYNADSSLLPNFDMSAFVAPLWSEAQQDGAGQPATRPVVEPEGSEKPQPEAEGRSR